MFQRLRQTWAALRPGKEPNERLAARRPDVYGFIAAHGDRVRRIAEGVDEEKPPRNPVVVGFEIALVATVVAYSAPWLSDALSISGRAGTFFSVVAGISLYGALEWMRQRILMKTELRFLDPYFGHRMTKTIQILRRAE